MSLYIPVLPQPFPDFRLPARCFISMSESVTEVLEGELDHTVLGKTIILPGPWGSKFRISLSSGEQAIPLPEDVFGWGQRVRYDSATFRTMIVPAGVGRVTFSRACAKVTARSVDDDQDLQPVNGREMFLDPSHTGALVRFRYRHSCLVSSSPSYSKEVTGRGLSHTVELIEEYPA